MVATEYHGQMTRTSDKHRASCRTSCIVHRESCECASRGVHAAAFFRVDVGRTDIARSPSENRHGLEHADKVEQEIAASCNRLIRNCIICWNHLYMARRLEAAGSLEERDRLLGMIAVHSPQPWEDFNLLGKYDSFQREASGQYRRTTPKIGSRDRPREFGAAIQINRTAHQQDMEKAVLLYIPLSGFGRC